MHGKQRGRPDDAGQARDRPAARSGGWQGGWAVAWAAALLLGGEHAARAAVNVFTAAGGDAYAATNNWTLGTVPGDGNNDEPRIGVAGHTPRAAAYATATNYTTSGRLLVGLGTGSVGALTLSGAAGTLTFGGGPFGSANYVGVDGGTGTVALAAGTLSICGAGGAGVGGHLHVGANGGVSTGTVTVDGGVLAVGTRMTLGVGYPGDLANVVGNNGNGNATLTIAAGSVSLGTGSNADTDKGWLYLKSPAGGTGTATVNLNGGVLSLRQFQAGAGGTAKIVNFNGGIVQARTNNVSFLSAGAVLNVRDGGAVFDTAGWDVAVGGALLAAGSGGLRKQGAGTLTLAMASTYSGPTVVSNGTLQVAAAPGGVTAGCALWFDAADGGTLFQDLEGTQPVARSGDPVALWKDKSGHGRDVSQGAVAQRPTCQFDVQNGRAVVRFDGINDVLSRAAAGLTNTPLSVCFVFSPRYATLGYNPGIVGIRTATATRLSIHAVGNRAGINTWNGGVVGATAPLALASNAFVEAAAIDTGAAQTLASGGRPLVSQAYALGSTAAAVLNLGSSNGLGEWLNGDLAEVLIYTNALGTAQLQAVASYLQTKWLSVLPAGSALALAGGTVLDLNGGHAAAAGLTDLGGRGTVTNSAANQPARLAFGPASGTNTFSGTIGDRGVSNALSIVKTGGGTQILTGTNGYRGLTVIRAGTLAFASGSLGQGGVAFTGSGVLQWRGSNTTDISTPPATFGAGAVAGLDTGSNTVVLAGALDGSGGMDKRGAGLLVLAGTNTHAGITRVLAGTLKLACPLALQASTLNWNNDGGALDLTALNRAVFGGLQGAQALALPRDFALSVGANSTTYAGGLGGTNAALTKVGGGTLVLTGNNRYTGPTTVNAGTLQFAGTGSVYNNGTGAGAVTVNAGGTLAFGRHDTFGNHLARPVTAVVVNPGGLVQNAATFTTLMDLTLNGAELRANGGASASWPAYQLKGRVAVVGSAASHVTATASANACTQIQLGDNTVGGVTTFDVADATGTPAADLTVLAALQDGRNAGYAAVASGLVKTGPGTLVLSNATFTGATTVNDGTLLVDGAQAGAGLWTVNGGVLGGRGSVAGPVGIGARGTLAPDGLTVKAGIVFVAGGCLRVDIGEGGASRLAVTGSLVLNGARLNVTVAAGFVPAPGTVYPIIAGFSNTDPGTFDGLPQGGVLQVSPSVAFVVNYDTVNRQVTLAASRAAIGTVLIVR